MNLLKKSSLALVAGLLMAGGASAATICTGCAYRFANDGQTGQIAAPVASYIGTYAPGDGGTFTHQGLGDGSFSDWWVFDVNPAALGEWQAIFTVSAGVTNFSATMFSNSGAACTNGYDTVGALGFTVAGTCTSTGVQGAVIGSNTPGNNSLNLLNLNLAAGQYAVHVTGTSTTFGAANLYSGNINLRKVPEPGTLALAALGLLAAGAGLRRRG